MRNAQDQACLLACHACGGLDTIKVKRSISRRAASFALSPGKSVKRRACENVFQRCCFLVTFNIAASGQQPVKRNIQRIAQVNGMFDGNGALFAPATDGTLIDADFSSQCKGFSDLPVFQSVVQPDHPVLMTIFGWQWSSNEINPKKGSSIKNKVEKNKHLYVAFKS